MNDTDIEGFSHEQLRALALSSFNGFEAVHKAAVVYCKAILDGVEEIDRLAAAAACGARLAEWDDWGQVCFTIPGHRILVHHQVLNTLALANSDENGPVSPLHFQFIGRGALGERVMALAQRHESTRGIEVGLAEDVETCLQAHVQAAANVFGTGRP